jgi:hypothetical protein
MTALYDRTAKRIGIESFPDDDVTPTPSLPVKNPIGLVGFVRDDHSLMTMQLVWLCELEAKKSAVVLGVFGLFLSVGGVEARGLSKFVAANGRLSMAVVEMSKQIRLILAKVAVSEMYMLELRAFMRNPGSPSILRS